MSDPVFVREESGRIVVKPSVIYPRYLAYVYSGRPVGEITQGDLETARLAFTEDMMQVLGKPLHIYIEKDERFALRNYPLGSPPIPAVGSFYRDLPETPARRLGIVLN